MTKIGRFVWFGFWFLVFVLCFFGPFVCVWINFVDPVVSLCFDPAVFGGSFSLDNIENWSAETRLSFGTGAICGVLLELISVLSFFGCKMIVEWVIKLFEWLCSVFQSQE